MQNDETTPEVELDENQIDIDTTEETSTEESTGESKNWEAEAKKWEAIAKRKAKREANAPVVPLKDNPALPEELKLIARGLSDEDIEQAKIISKGKDISLSEAIKDPLFIAHQNAAKEQKRKEDAKLGATRGSGQVETKGFKSGMTADEHKALWREQNS